MSIRLIKPASVIFTHVNEAATEGGKLKANTQSVSDIRNYSTAVALRHS